MVRNALATVVACLLLAGCRGHDTAGSGSGAAPARAEKKGVPEPRNADVYEDAFVIGRAMDGDQAADATDSFKPGERVCVSWVVQNAKPGWETRVEWTRLRDHKVVATEKKPLPSKPGFVSFTADTTGWEPGSYQLVKQITGDDPNNPWRFLGSKDLTIRPK